MSLWHAFLHLRPERGSKRQGLGEKEGGMERGQGSGL